MTQDTISIDLPSKTIVLKLTSFDTDIDADELTKIHYHNIAGEIMTSSVAMNRIGNLQAEMDALLSETKLDFDIFYANKEAEFRKSLVKHVVTSRSEKYEEPTNSEIDAAITRLPEFKEKKMHIIDLQKNKSYIDSLYWTLRDKCDKINRITDKIRPEEFEKEILEDTINGVIIKVREKLIK